MLLDEVDKFDVDDQESDVTWEHLDALPGQVRLVDSAAVHRGNPLVGHSQLVKVIPGKIRSNM